MKNSRFSLLILLLIIKSVNYAQHPASYLNVHCEPQNAHLFNKLVEMVQLADSFGIPLNVQLTPQWGTEILNDPAKLLLVRQWQINGHEIGAHHHGIEAGTGWDGYTNHPPADLTHPQLYNGTMQDYMNILNLVAGDSLILNGGFGDTFDWPMGVLFRTFGHALEDAISQPVHENNNGQDCQLILYCVAYTENKVDSLIELFSSANSDDIFGFNNHVFNFEFDQAYLRKWMQFIQDKNNKTIRQIMREKGLFTSIRDMPESQIIPSEYFLFQNYPNPFNPNTVIRYAIPRLADYKSVTHVTLKIYDILGNEVAALQNGAQSPGYYERTWNAEYVSSGIYFYILIADEFREVKKMLLVK